MRPSASSRECDPGDQHRHHGGRGLRRSWRRMTTLELVARDGSIRDQLSDEPCEPPLVIAHSQVIGRRRFSLLKYTYDVANAAKNNSGSTTKSSGSPLEK